MSGISAGCSIASAVSPTLIPLGPPLRLLADPDGQLAVSFRNGTLDISVSGTADYDGVYTVNVSQLETGPVNLVPPTLIGAAEIGQTLALKPGLWIYSLDGGEPSIGYQWQSDGADIESEVGLSYTVQQADAGGAIRVMETAVNALGENSAASDARIATASVFVDTFDQPNGTLLGDEPQYVPIVLSGTGRTEAFDGIARANGPTCNEVVAYANPVDADQFAEAQLSLVGSTSTELVLYVRFNSNDDWHGVIVDGSNARRARKSGGIFSWIGASYPVVDGDIVRLEAIGSTFRLVINGSEAESSEDLNVTIGQPAFKLRPKNQAVGKEISYFSCGDL